MIDIGMFNFVQISNVIVMGGIDIILNLSAVRYQNQNIHV
jgi:hypothetical protein